MSKVSIHDLPIPLSKEIADAVGGYTWRENTVGNSSTSVYRLEAKDKETVYLKAIPRNLSAQLLQEKERLDWLSGRLPVPETLIFSEGSDLVYLLLSEVAGVDASNDPATDIPQIIRQMALGLRRIHSLPIEGCPFDMRLDMRISYARERMQNGFVDQEDFDSERLGRTAQDLFEEIIATRPVEDDLVFTHGDYCVPNVVLKAGKLGGFIDWADAGVADRHQDIALLSRSVVHNFGEEWENTVYESYGLEPDREKVKFYRLLDEFF